MFRRRIDQFLVQIDDLMHIVQPEIGNADALLLQSSGHPAATIVSNHHDVLDLEHVDRVLDDRQAVEVGMHHQVGDVAVHEDLARQQADDLVGRHPRVGAADPQELRRLQVARRLEVSRVDFLHLARPGAVEVEEVDRGFRYLTSSSDQFSRSRRHEHGAFDRGLVVIGRRFA